MITRASLRRISLLAILLVGCASNVPGGDPSASPTTVEQVSAPSHVSVAEQGELQPQALEEAQDLAKLVAGTATDFRLLTLEETSDDQDLDFGPEGELLLVECRWRGPGLYSFDMSWEPKGEVEWPVMILVSQGIMGGDVGFGWGGYVTLSGPGAFSIPHNSYQVDEILGQQVDEGMGASAHRSSLGSEQRASCVTGELEGRTQVLVDPIPPAPAPDGTIEELVGRIDLSDEESPLLPLAMFAPQLDPFEVDRLFIAPKGRLDSINASLRAGCLSIRSVYLVSAESKLFVEQTLRCPGGPSPELGKRVALPDEVWDVAVTGPADVVDSFADGIEDVPFADVPRLDASEGSFDPTAAVDAAIQESGFTEIVRVPWGGGLVAIGYFYPEFSGERYADPVIAVPEFFGGGGGGMGCQDFAIVEQGDSQRGFGFVVVEDANHQVVRVVNGERIVLDSIPAADGRAVVFFDKGQQPNIVMRSLTVIDEAGEVVPCVQ